MEKKKKKEVIKDEKFHSFHLLMGMQVHPQCFHCTKKKSK